MIREGAEFRELMLQIVRTRMAFRRSMQRTLRKNNAGITFEMLQVLSSLWHEQGISQQILAERFAKDKACLTNLMNNLEKKGYVQAKRYGNTYVYSPSIDEGEYKTKFLSGVVQNYFENSYKEMVTFFARKQKISAKELEEIIRLIEKE